MRIQLLFLPLLMLLTACGGTTIPMAAPVSDRPLLTPIYFDKVMPANNFTRHVTVSANGMMVVVDINPPGKTGTTTASLLITRLEMTQLQESLRDLNSFADNYPGPAGAPHVTIKYGNKTVHCVRGTDNRDAAAKIDKISTEIEYIADRVINKQPH